MSPRIARFLADSAIAVIGCGGTGVMTILQLAHLGVKQIIACDPDRLDATNLNRYPIALPGDVGRFKVEVVAEFLQRRRPDCEIVPIAEAFPTESILDHLQDVNALVCCVDSIPPRIKVDVTARSMGKTLLDIGVGFRVNDEDGHVEAAGGQVLVSRPGGACLSCLGFRGNLSEHNYFLPSSSVPEPSSFLLNCMAATLACECLLADIDGSLRVNRLAYDRGDFRTTGELLPPCSSCSVCGVDAASSFAHIGDLSFLVRELEMLNILCKTS
jgi:molybdopterin/thiamine biosynthesis adenylyltransferase